MASEYAANLSVHHSYATSTWRRLSVRCSSIPSEDDECRFQSILVCVQTLSIAAYHKQATWAGKAAGTVSTCHDNHTMYIPKLISKYCNSSFRHPLAQQLWSLRQLSWHSQLEQQTPTASISHTNQIKAIGITRAAEDAPLYFMVFDVTCNGVVLLK